MFDYGLVEKVVLALLLLHCVIDDYMAIWDFVFIVSNLCKLFAKLFVSVVTINRILNWNHRERFVSLRPFLFPWACCFDLSENSKDVLNSYALQTEQNSSEA